MSGALLAKLMAFPWRQFNQCEVYWENYNGKCENEQQKTIGRGSKLIEFENILKHKYWMNIWAWDWIQWRGQIEGGGGWDGEVVESMAIKVQFRTFSWYLTAWESFLSIFWVVCNREIFLHSQVLSMLEFLSTSKEYWNSFDIIHENSHEND